MPWIHDCLHLVSISVSFIWFSESSFTVITGPVSCSPMGEFVLMSHIFFHLNAAFFFFLHYDMWKGRMKNTSGLIQPN